MPTSLQFTLDFLADLRTNNNKVWFDEHRKRYEQARATFEAFVTDVINRFETVDDLSGTSAKDCMFRINRDMRFSKDKSPYNIGMSASFAKGGRKGTGRSYYLSFQPGESFAGGGLYMPSSAELERIRQDITHHKPNQAPRLRQLIDAPDFKRSFGQMHGDALKTVPQGYAKDHPEIDLIRHKQFLATHAFTDAQIVASDFADQVIAVCGALRPFVGYFHEVLG